MLGGSPGGSDIYTETPPPPRLSGSGPGEGGRQKHGGGEKD